MWVVNKLETFTKKKYKNFLFLAIFVISLLFSFHSCFTTNLQISANNSIFMDNSLLSQNFSSRNKKLIESGWDTKDAVFIRDHIQDMEATGSFFDGIRFKLQKEEYLAFEKIPLTEKDINLSVLESINWSRFTDNFIQVQGSSQNNDPDWFDNSLWNTIIANTRMLSKALKAGKCKGIIF